jgi:hypothetical protein
LFCALAVFLAVQGTLIVVQLVWPLPLRNPDFAARLRCLKERTKATPRPTTVLILGSSRSQMGVRAGEMENVLSASLGRPVVTFSFAKSGCGPLGNLITWHQLLRNGVLPDLLIFEIMPGMMVDSFDDLTEIQSPTSTMTWDDLAVLERYAGSDRSNIRHDWIKEFACPWHSQRRALIGRAFPALLPPWQRIEPLPMANASGDIPLARDAAGPEKRALALRTARNAFNDRLAGLGHWARSRRALRELLGSCREAGVPVALLITPEGPVFRSLYPPGRWQKFHSQLCKLAHEYGAALVDARQWVDSESAFLDSHHLNLAPAEAFSRRLAEEAILPLLRPPNETPPRDQKPKLAHGSAPKNPGPGK